MAEQWKRELGEIQFEPDYETRHARIYSLKISTAEIIFDEMKRLGFVGDGACRSEQYQAIETRALNIASAIIGQLWPWGDFVNVVRVEEDLSAVGPSRPRPEFSEDDDDLPF